MTLRYLLRRLGCSAVADAGPTKTTITPQTRQNGEFYEQSK